jgi:hypothetical protein
MDNLTAEQQESVRQLLIGLLAANDRNGSYTDDDARAEGWQPLTLSQCMQLATDQGIVVNV